MEELVVPPGLCRNRVDDAENIDNAVWLIDHLCSHLGLADLGDVALLDFGCGLRFTQAFLNRGVPIQRYVGVDVSRDVIEFLRDNVHDDRFEYCHLDAQNELYNPGGLPLETLTVPELEGREFDVICLFSVFTHLAPADYSAMLRLLRRYVRPNGRLFYTLFINEVTAGGHGYADAIARGMVRAAAGDGAVPTGELATGFIPPDFVDADPARPLNVALYSRQHAMDLIEGTGWTLLSIDDPLPLLQHHVVCAPR